MMRLPTFVVNTSSLDDFISFWSVQYNYAFDDLYDNNIRLNKLEPENLQQLYFWKNGMRLSSNKEIRVNKIVLHIDVINNLKKHGFDPIIFDQYFSDMTLIWKIFLIHIICPDEYPIFDQHVYRAYRFINNLPAEPLPESKDKATIKYDNCYRPFYQKIQDEATGFSSKKIDEALWAFGKFLSTYPKMMQ